MSIQQVLNDVSGNGNGAENPHLSQDIRLATRIFYGFIASGVAAILGHTGITPVVTTPFLWGLACLTAGATFGFLFGIPKIHQSNLPLDDTPSQSPNMLSVLYRQQVNTNLTEISDWLTKIIIGLGLINLTKIPPYLNRIACILAGGINETHPNKERAFALALIIFFFLLGCLYGY